MKKLLNSPKLHVAPSKITHYTVLVFLLAIMKFAVFLALSLSLFLFSFLLLLLFSPVYCLSVVYGLSDVDLSVIARQGSGSASRSVYGGFVSWEKGEREDGKDSIAVQVRRKEGGREGRGNPVNCTIIFISLSLSLSPPGCS